MSKYTVIVLSPSTYWSDGIPDMSFVECVEAADPNLASWIACETLASRYTLPEIWEDNAAPGIPPVIVAGDFHVLAVFKGVHKDVHEPSVQSVTAQPISRATPGPLED